MDGSFEQQVRQRAYEIWVALGQADGQAHEHWAAAEQDVLSATIKPKRKRTVKAKTADDAAKPTPKEKMPRATAKSSRTRN